MKFIAEIGLNHNGNLDLCHELIRQAKWAGADIAKFQLGWRAKKDEINHISLEPLKRNISLEFIWFKDLKSGALGSYVEISKNSFNTNSPINFSWLFTYKEKF